jgi:hypothetical protein
MSIVRNASQQRMLIKLTPALNGSARNEHSTRAGESV